MNEREIFLEMRSTKAAIELVEATDTGDERGIAAMKARMEELTDMLADKPKKGAT